MRPCSILIFAMTCGCTGINEHRTTGTFIEDFSIERKVARFIKNDSALKDQTHVNATSYNEVLLLTGQVPTEKLRQIIIDNAGRVSKVKKIHDFLTIAAPSSMISRTNDSYLTTKVKTHILASVIFKKEKNIKVDRIKVVTENSVVFLLGVVSKKQANIASQIARKTPGVQKVVRLWELL